MPSDRLERAVLLTPDAIARRAAELTDEPEARWMLRRPRAVRRSYITDVLDRDQQDLRQEIWMLRQGDDVRESYVREVLLPRMDDSAGSAP